METKWKCINLRLDFIRLQGIDAWKLRFNTSNSHVSTLARRNQWPSRIADVKHELLVTWTVRELQMILFSGKWVPKNDSFLVHRVMFHFNDFGRKGGIYIYNEHTILWKSVWWLSCWPSCCSIWESRRVTLYFNAIPPIEFGQCIFILRIEFSTMSTQLSISNSWLRNLMQNQTTSDFPSVHFQPLANNIKMNLPMLCFTSLGPEFEHPRVELLDYHLICPEHIRHKPWKIQVVAGKNTQ